MIQLFFLVFEEPKKTIKYQMVNNISSVGILFAKDVVLRLEDESFSNISNRLGEVYLKNQKEVLLWREFMSIKEKMF